VKFGVVIPTLDEAAALPGALRSVGGPGAGDDAGDTLRPLQEPTEIEIVVVDGGSRDDTRSRARALGTELGARLIELPRDVVAGRSRQLAAGAEACAGDVLVFLHADTRLPPGWPRAIARALADPRVVGGAFRFRFAPEEGRSPLLRLIEWGARLRGAWLRLPYGDQALFVRRTALARMGGVPRTPFMEDLDLVRAMKAQGAIALLPEPASTSSRRYRQRGVLRTFARNLVALLGWRLGVDRDRLAAWYRR